MTSQPFIDETLLLKQIAQHEQAALSTLYDRYAHALYALAFKILGSVEEAEEVVLDVFSQVWETAQKYDAKRGRVDTWLFLMTRSRALDRLRAKQRQLKVLRASANAPDVTSSLSAIAPEDALLRSEQRDRIQAALAQLPVAQRQALELAYFKGLTYKEIAAKTGKSFGTVKTRLRLGLKKLREILNAP